MSYTSKTLRFSSSVQVILCFQMQMMCVHNDDHVIIILIPLRNRPAFLILKNF